MNERIYNLSLLADQYAHSICDRDEYADWYQTRDQKFAELIVRECIANCDDLNSMKYIASHFGVEIEGLK
jgi:hypothetical protein